MLSREWYAPWRRRLFGTGALVATCVAATNCTERPARIGSIAWADSVTLSSPDSAIDLRAHTPAVAHNGDYIVQYDTPPSGGAAVFDSRGTFITTVGTPGAGGPGEYRQLSSAGFGAGDTIWILDGMLTAHAFTPTPNVRYLRTVRLDHLTTGEITRWGVLAPVSVSNGAGLPATLTGFDGHESAHFGDVHALAEIDRFMGPVFAIDSARVWLARGATYALDLVTSARDTLRRVSRDVPWFPPNVRMTGAPWVARPPPRIKSVFADNEARLWIFVRRAHRHWEPRSIGGTARDGPISIRGLPSAVEVNELYEGVIDVLDSRTGQLLASREVDGSVIGFTTSGMLCAVVESPTGSVALRLIRPEIHR